MLNRRWTTAWRLFRSGKFKELLSRTFRFLSSPVVKKNEINYSEWRGKWVELNEEDRQRVRDHIQTFPHRLSFTLLLDTQDHDSTDVLQTIKSLLTQLYLDWFLWVVDHDSLDTEIRKKILDLQDDRIRIVNSNPSVLGDWVVELKPGIELHEKALFANAFLAINKPAIELIYSDHDHKRPSGEFCDPYMKPDWNPDLFNAMNYFEPLVACKRELWSTYRDGESDKHEFLLEVTKSINHNSIFHISNVLASVPVDPDETHLEPACKRIAHSLPTPEPLVSILIPTHNNGQLLEKCLESLFGKTSYPNFEVVLINHETSESKALKVIKEFEKKSNFKTINFSGSFNFAAMMNLAGNAALGDAMVLLNDDVEIIDSGWLTELISQVSRPEVGIVGALLLFGDGTIQHAGVHPGLGGLMGHGHKHLLCDEPGYFSRLKAVHEVAAVTGACMAIEKSTWVDLGGMNEDLAVAYNDIDLCLKIRRKGLRVLFSPYAKLLHHESVSRGPDEPPEKNQRLQSEIKLMEEKWGDFLYVDPAYSPNLSLSGAGFRLAENPEYRPLSA